jgi:hypothetical protein
MKKLKNVHPGELEQEREKNSEYAKIIPHQARLMRDRAK